MNEENHYDQTTGDGRACRLGLSQRLALRKPDRGDVKESFIVERTNRTNEQFRLLMAKLGYGKYVGREEDVA